MCAESLVELKKQRLLVMLHPTEGAGEEQVGVASTIEQLGEREEEEEEEVEVVGMKCRAPLEEVRRCLNLVSIDDWILMMTSCTVMGFNQLPQCHGALC